MGIQTGKQSNQLITLVHTFSFDTPVAGGIESWISDFIEHSSLRIRILGLGKPIDSPKENVTFIPIGEMTRRRRFIPDVIRFAMALTKYRRKISENVLVHRIELALVVRMLHPKSKITLVIHTNLFKQLMRGSDSLWRYFSLLYPLFEAIALRTVDNVLSHSLTDFPRLKKKFRSATFIPAWFDSSVFYPLPDVRKKWTFLWVGRFETVKDPLLAISAFSIFNSTGASSLLMVGSGLLESRIRDEIRRLNLADNVFIRQPVSQEKLAVLYCEAESLVITSHFEGSPRVVVESLACGVPVVAVREADPDGWLGPGLGGVYSRSRESADFADAMRAACNRQFSDLSKLVSGRSAALVVPFIDDQILGKS